MDDKPGKSETWCPDMHPLLHWALERPLTYGACFVIAVSVVLALASRGYDDGSDPAFFEFHAPGQRAVAQYGRIVKEEARMAGVDADLVRAILYVDNETVRPMNINPTLWEGLGGINKANAADPRINIRAGVVLIKRIAERIIDPTPRKIATLYHHMGRTRVSQDRNGYAARVGYVLRHKLWKLDVLAPHPSSKPGFEDAPDPSLGP